MFVNVIPAGALEFLLFLALASAFGFVVFRVARRSTHLPDPVGIEDVVSLTTPSRVTISIEKIFLDADLVLATVLIGDQRLSFCLADYASNVERYKAALKAPMTIAPYALASFASVAENAYLNSRSVSDTVGDVGLSLVYSGPRRNDYTIRGTIISVRKDELDGDSVFVYRFASAGGLVLEVAAEATPDSMPFAAGDHVPGTARLYAFAPAANDATLEATPHPPAGASRQ